MSAVVSLRITLRYSNVEEFSSRYAENLSSGGLFLRTRAPKPVGTRVRFELLLSDGRPVLVGEGVVVAVRHDDKAGMALRFRLLSADSRTLVERIVAMHGEGALAPAPLVPAFGKRAAGSSLLPRTTSEVWRLRRDSFGGGLLPRDGSWMHAFGVDRADGTRAVAEARDSIGDGGIGRWGGADTKGASAESKPRRGSSARRPWSDPDDSASGAKEQSEALGRGQIAEAREAEAREAEAREAEAREAEAREAEAREAEAREAEAREAEAREAEAREAEAREAEAREAEAREAEAREAEAREAEAREAEAREAEAREAEAREAEAREAEAREAEAREAEAREAEAREAEAREAEAREAEAKEAESDAFAIDVESDPSSPAALAVGTNARETDAPGIVPDALALAIDVSSDALGVSGSGMLLPRPRESIESDLRAESAPTVVVRSIGEDDALVTSADLEDSPFGAAMVDKGFLDEIETGVTGSEPVAAVPVVSVAPTTQDVDVESVESVAESDSTGSPSWDEAETDGELAPIPRAGRRELDSKAPEAGTSLGPTSEGDAPGVSEGVLERPDAAGFAHSPLAPAHPHSGPSREVVRRAIAVAARAEEVLRVPNANEGTAGNEAAVARPNDVATPRPSVSSEGEMPSPARRPSSVPPEARAIGIDLRGRSLRIGRIVGGHVEHLVKDKDGSPLTFPLLRTEEDGRISDSFGTLDAPSGGSATADGVWLRDVLATFALPSTQSATTWNAPVDAEANVAGPGGVQIPVDVVLGAFWSAILRAVPGIERPRAALLVPHGLAHTAQNWLKTSAASRGIEHIEFVSQPFAALLAYDVEAQPVDSVLLVDLDAEHLFVSVMKRGREGFAVAAYRNTPAVRGVEIENKICDHVAEKFGITGGADSWLRAQVKRACETLKKEPSVDLSSGDSAQAPDQTIKISRVKVHHLSEDLAPRIQAVAKEVLGEAGVHPRAVGAVIVTGLAAGHIPIEQALTTLTHRDPMRGLDPDDVYLVGLVKSAELAPIRDRREPLFALETDIGIELPGHRFFPLVVGGTRLPCRVFRRHAAHRDEMVDVEFGFFEGQGESTLSCVQIGRLVLKDVKKHARGPTQVDLELEVDRDAVVTVTMSEATSGAKRRFVAATSQTPAARRRQLETSPKIEEPESAERPKKTSFFGRLLGRG